MERTKLTHYAAKGGCACKIGPHILAKALAGFFSSPNERVLVDMQGADDAGVFLLNKDLALVQTMDFFTPIVDDPRLFGRIAAANSLSDVYAMGGRPLTAMNIVAFPVPLVENGCLREVLEGAKEVLDTAQVLIMGGHSVENEVPLFGLSITGQVKPQKIWTNGGARPGDRLLLTKPLGTGLMATALKGDLFPKGTQEAVESMCRLNKTAAELASAYDVHACTDVTGFSLLGHGLEMAEGSQLTLVIHTEDLPLFSQVIEAARMGLVPAATYGNRKALSAKETSKIHFSDDLAPVWWDICFDPQTSGGLLLALSEGDAQALLRDLERAGHAGAQIIGYVKERGDYSLEVK